MIYIKEKLQKFVAESISVSEVIRRFGQKVSGGSHSHVKRKIEEYGIDTSHFLGKASRCGQKSNPNKKDWAEILIKRKQGNRQKLYQLRRALIEAGRNYICEVCEHPPEWKGKELRLQVDHKNTDWLDDRKENLRFICPNCHTQTLGFSGSKGLSEVTSVAKAARNSRMQKKEKTPKQTDPNWRIKPKLHLRKIERPNLETLLKEVEEQNYSMVGRKYGVSDNCIRKWIKFEIKLRDSIS